MRGRRTLPRPRTMALRELKSLARRTVRLEVLDERPKTRGDCADVPRPCPWVACRYHLYLTVNEETGSIKFNFPHLRPDELEESCALDVADEGEHSLEAVGELCNMTRERARQLEARTLAKVEKAKEMR